MWLSLHLRGGLTGLLINSDVPTQLRAVKLDFAADGLIICLYVWPPLDEAIKTFFKEQVLPKYIDKVFALGIPDVRVRLRYVEYAGPGYMVDGEDYEVPIEHQKHGRMVWQDATMWRPGTFEPSTS